MASEPYVAGLLGLPGYGGDHPFQCVESIQPTEVCGAPSAAATSVSAPPIQQARSNPSPGRCERRRRSRLRDRTATSPSQPGRSAADLIPRAEAILKKIASNAPIAVKLALEVANKDCCWKLPTSASVPPPRTRRRARPPFSKSAHLSSTDDEGRTHSGELRWQPTTFFPDSKS